MGRRLRLRASVQTAKKKGDKPQTKKEMFENAESQLREQLSKLKLEERVVDAENTTPIDILKQAQKAIKSNMPETASMLLRSVYRRIAIREARTLIAASRHAADDVLKKKKAFVRKRASMLKKNASSQDIALTKKKMLTDHSKFVVSQVDAVISILEQDAEIRGGHFYENLPSTFEVNLPKNAEDKSSITKASAHVIFNTAKAVDKRLFAEEFSLHHGDKSNLQAVSTDYNLYVVKLPVLGFAKPFNVSRTKQGVEILLSDRQRMEFHKLFGKEIVLVPVSMTHRKSELYWYAYNFPAKPISIQFADKRLVDDFNSVGDSPLDSSSDDYVKRIVQNESTRRNMAMLELKHRREKFIQDNKELVDKLAKAKKELEKLEEARAEFALQFRELTAINLTTEADTKSKEEGAVIVTNDGIYPSAYSSIKRHFKKMREELEREEYDEDRKVEIPLLLSEEKVKARVLYYYWQELGVNTRKLKEQIAEMQDSLDFKRDLARGSGRIRTEEMAEIE